MITSAQRVGRSKSSRGWRTSASQLRQKDVGALSWILRVRVIQPVKNAIAGAEDERVWRARTQQERGCGISLFVVSLIEIVPKAEIQSETLGDFPVILEESSELDVAPVPDVGAELRGRCGVIGSCLTWWLADSGVHAGCLQIGRVSCELDLVVEVIRRTRDVELAVFDVPPEIH